MSPLVAAGIGGLLAAAAFVAGLAALRRGRRLGACTGLLGALTLGLASALLAALAAGVAGYSALTREELAATVRTVPLTEGEFEAHFEFPGGRRARYRLAGDQLAVEARILKWHPWANLLGLHTAYELDRVAGRYARLADEQSRPRTVYALGPDRRVDLFAWAEGLAWLSPLVDARYGSGSFRAATRPARYEIRVSTSGLLIREVPGGGGVAGPTAGRRGSPESGS